MILASQIAHFSVDDYHRMIDAGIFIERRVELVDGLILEMSPEGTEHTSFEENLAKKLEKLTEGRAYIRENKPVNNCRVGNGGAVSAVARRTLYAPSHRNPSSYHESLMSEESIDLGNWYKLKKKWVIPTLTAMYLVSLEKPL